jgi:hypothetical protein
MRRALRRAGWALAAAGGIGIAAPATAQTQPVEILGPGGHVEQTGEVVIMTEAKARLEEGQVELGLLADPMLFSYGLGTRVQGATLEVRGFVPNEDVRDQALKVAREQTTLHVIDKLKIQPNLATRCSVDKPEHIQRAAKELLEEAMPAYGRGMDVKCDARGRVTVTGSVASNEDRVLVSRKLRQVSGCSCVANQLEVVAAVTESRPAVTTGTVPIPDAPPAMVRPAVRKSEPEVPAVPARTVAAPQHVEPPPPALTMPRVYQEPVSLPAPQPPVVKPLPELPAVPKTVVVPPMDVPPPPAKVESRPTLPAPKPVPSIDRDKPSGIGSPTTAVIDLPPVEHAKPQPAVKLPQVVNEPAVPSPKPPPLPPVVPLTPRPTVAPPPKPADVVKPTRGSSEESYVTEGTITLDYDPPPAKPVATPKAPTTPKPTPPALPPVSAVSTTPAPVKPAAAPAKATPAPAKPAEGTMTLTPPPMPPSRPASDPVKLSAAPAKPPAPAAPPRPNVPAAVRLKERIQGACGPAYEVKVTTRNKNYLQLEITGPVAGEETRIMQRIKPVLESEEFRGFELNVDVITPVK